MKNNRKIPRIHTSANLNVHGTNRSKLRSHSDIDSLDNMAPKESIRDAIWRTKNSFGEDTRFDGICSGEPSYRYFAKLMRKHIGRSYNKYYSEMCALFKGLDRIAFDRYIHFAFTPYGWGGLPLFSEYSVKNGVIVKNKR